MKIKLHPLSDDKRRRRRIKIKLNPYRAEPKYQREHKIQKFPEPCINTKTSFLSPPSTLELGSTASVYGQYNLTAEEATITGIRALDYVKIESPQFVNRCEKIPSDLQTMIHHFDLVWVLSVESSYAEKRRWNDFISFREFLQNSLDSMHESVGYENIKVDISVDTLGTWVMDKGKGLEHTAFMLGGKEKKCYLRGRYGEGLKVAALWFASRNHDIYIFTRDTVFKCFYPEAGLLTVVFGKSKKYIDGTWVLIKGYKVPSEDVRKLYYKLSDFDIVFRHDVQGTDCNYKMPNLILEPGDSLYVRDIFVNNISELFGTPCFYSYNLWWVELEPNRVQVQSTWEFNRELSGLLVNSESIKNIIQNCIEMNEYGGIKYYLIHPRYYEMKLNFPAPPDFTATVISTWLKQEYGIVAYSIPGDLDGVAAVAHEGGKCILVPDNTLPLFYNLKKAADFVITSKAETLNGEARKDERTLSHFSRGTLRAWRIIADFVVPEIKVVVISGKRAFYQAGTIYITEDNLDYREIDTFIHELAHAHGAQLYEDAPDLSENFEDALAKVGTLIYDLAMSRNERSALKRAEQGAIFAEVKSAEDFFGSTLYDLLYKVKPRTLEKLLQYPSMFIIIADSEIFMPGLIRVEEKPAEEYYEKELKAKLKIYSEIIRDLLADREKKEINIIEQCDRIEFNAFLAAYIRNHAEVVMIYYYYLPEDRYIFGGKYKKEVNEK